MSESDQTGGKPNGAVGYGRPPVNSQFKPGQSGNPKGRPKGSKNFATRFAEALSKPIRVRDRNNGKIRTLSKLDVMIEAITAKAMAGDPKAFATVIQLADKHQVFKALTPSNAEVVASLKAKIEGRLARLGVELPTSPDTPTQSNPNMK